MKSTDKTMNFRIIKLYLLLQISSIVLVAQSVENVTNTLFTDDSKHAFYYIYYDLLAPYNNIPCEVKFKVTVGNASFYSKTVTGDVGNLVLPGVRKKIIWDHVEELVHYNGSVSIFIEVAPNVKVVDKIKKGKPLSIQVSPFYDADKKYTIKLYRKGIELAKLNEVLINEGVIPVALPPKSKVGKKYQLMLSDGEHDYYSNTFKVKPKVGNGWKALPFIAIPAYILVKNYLEDQKPLPGPPTIN
jgi:hypothetical protein